MAQIFYDHVSGRYFKSTMKQLHDWEVKLFSESNGLYDRGATSLNTEEKARS